MFFKDPVEKQPDPEGGGDALTEYAPLHPRRSITLAITDGDAKTFKEMTVFPFVIGREYFEGGLQLDNKSVSRRHAIVELQSYGITITDENSSNGVKVAGKRLVPGERLVLKSGDDINIGGVMISVMDISDPAELAADPELTDLGDRTQLLFPQQTAAPGYAPERGAVSPLKYDPPPVRQPEPAFDKPPAAAYQPPPAALPPTFCVQCGHPNRTEDSVFCKKCGARLVKFNM